MVGMLKVRKPPRKKARLSQNSLHNHDYSHCVLEHSLTVVPTQTIPNAFTTTMSNTSSFSQSNINNHSKSHEDVNLSPNNLNNNQSSIEVVPEISLSDTISKLKKDVTKERNLRQKNNDHLKGFKCAVKYTLDEFDESLVKEHYCGEMKFKCPHCEARFWALETTQCNEFTKCCNKGEVIMYPQSEPPPLNVCYKDKTLKQKHLYKRQGQ
jgi:hypothetical protein